MAKLFGPVRERSWVLPQGRSCSVSVRLLLGFAYKCKLIDSVEYKIMKFGTLSNIEVIIILVDIYYSHT